jgi:hypothetical protein
MWGSSYGVIVLALLSVARCSVTNDKPTTVILDLDHTLWDAYLDTDFLKKKGNVMPKAGDKNPFTWKSSGTVVDS